MFKSSMNQTNETVEEVVEPTVNAQTEGKASKPKNAPF